LTHQPQHNEQAQHASDDRSLAAAMSNNGHDSP
jgi:hypothetical protein